MRICGAAPTTHRQLLNLRVARFELLIEVLPFCGKRFLKGRGRGAGEVWLCVTVGAPLREKANSGHGSYLSVPERQLSVALPLCHILLQFGDLFFELGVLVAMEEDKRDTCHDGPRCARATGLCHQTYSLAMRSKSGSMSS